MTEEIETNNVQTMTIEDCLTALITVRSALSGIERAPDSESRIRVKRFVDTVNAIRGINPDLTIEDACKMLKLSADDIDLIAGYGQALARETIVRSILTETTEIRLALGRLGYDIGSKPNNRTVRSGGEGRHPDYQRYVGKCPICGKEIKASQKSLVTNSIFLHMQKEGEVADRDEFTEKYRQQINDSIIDTKE